MSSLASAGLFERKRIVTFVGLNRKGEAEGYYPSMVVFVRLHLLALLHPLLHLLQQLVVLRVGANPEPKPGIGETLGEGAVMRADPR